MSAAPTDAPAFPPEATRVSGRRAVAHIVDGILVRRVAGSPLYISNAHENDALNRYERKRWLFALRLYAPLAMSVYWWRYLR